MVQIISQASGLSLFILAIFTIGITAFLGVASNAILRDVGFGAILNGITATSGVILGVWIQMTFFLKM